MRVEFAHKTDKGHVRPLNEDYVWVNGAAGVYIVADGLGGNQAGEVASQLAAQTAGQAVVAKLRGQDGPLDHELKQVMVEAFAAANERVFSDGIETPGYRGMATVMVTAVVRPPNAFISHIGDVRAYLVRQATITRLTRDDSLVAELVAAGEISEAQAIRHPQRNIVTKVIGHPAPAIPSFLALQLQEADRLLLCSDGLWDMVGEEGILREMTMAKVSISGVADALVKAANAAGGKDNISVVVIGMLSAK